MAVYHSTSLIILREDLLQIANERLKEGETLLESIRPAGAMFLGGCALECYMKVAVCVTLRLGGLPSAFKTHDLEALLLYSGFRSDLEAQPAIQKSFAHIVGQWKPDGRESLLYAAIAGFEAQRSKRFFKYLTDPVIGVVPWLRSRISKQQ